MLPAVTVRKLDLGPSKKQEMDRDGSHGYAAPFGYECHLGSMNE